MPNAYVFCENGLLGVRSQDDVLYLLENSDEIRSFKGGFMSIALKTILKKYSLVECSTCDDLGELIECPDPETRLNHYNELMGQHKD